MFICLIVFLHQCYMISLKDHNPISRIPCCIKVTIIVLLKYVIYYFFRKLDFLSNIPTHK